MRCPRGQATVDYVALVALVAVLLALALGAASAGAAGVVNAVAGQIRHALCAVGGGPCPDLRSRPCAVATRRDTRHIAISMLVIRIDRDRHVLREEMSDGTIRLTVAGSGAFGGEIAVGGRATATVRGRQIGLRDEARAGAQAVAGRGAVYVARNAREAAAVLRAIRARHDPPIPARERFGEGGVRGLGTVAIGSAPSGASLRRLAGAVGGVRRDERTGAVTLSLHAAGSLWGALTVALGGPVASGERKLALALTLDRRRRAREISVAASFALAAGTALPPSFARALGGERGSASALSARTGGRRLELAGRLDLRDPLAAAAWRRFRGDPTGSDAIRGLGAAIRDRAHLDVRAYRTDLTTGGAVAGVALGVQVGGEYEHTVETSRLLAARSRPAGGLWERRLDCVPA
ncbi:MAG TPA: hypothetical protein VNT54_17575 [Solirubrobacteraceae bacterium]|nr:hypothetical protein [Solirubrobacteraceae bacterium]